MAEAQADAGQHVAALHAELVAAQEQAAAAGSALEAAARDVSQVQKGCVWGCSRPLSLSPSLSLPPAHTHTHSLSLPFHNAPSLWLCSCVGPLLLLLQASNAAAVERQQLAQLEVQVASLVGVMRQLLMSTTTDASGSGLVLPESPTRSGTPAIKVLSDLVDLFAAELSHKLRGAEAHAITAAQLEAQVARHQEELAQLQATLK